MHIGMRCWFAVFDPPASSALMGMRGFWAASRWMSESVLSEFRDMTVSLSFMIRLIS
tara:strand:- start:5844 stop:6014 length:171 start_codon:yes stop_codon:yes gene_type:complete